ncbi:hypothetical protein PIB30_006715 [Stylosanthes scabra]|uniref:Uncharacterized protein n=1 Tax=Stylosanthes scabra TaxID=79078 RepID=A0ABU6S4A6_9FABA|nr:hypothetical protein [Stylosanthes scabra]
MADQGRVQMIRDPEINRLDEHHHIVRAEEFQTPRCLATRGVVHTEPPPDCLVECIQEAGFRGPYSCASSSTMRQWSQHWLRGGDRRRIVSISHGARSRSRCRD